MSNEITIAKHNIDNEPNTPTKYGVRGIPTMLLFKGGELKATKVGINPKKIVFSGVGKSTDEIKYAIDKKILLINAESISEIKEIDKIAKSKNKKVMIGLRLNPNTDAKTLSQISTGKKENKFGVSEKVLLDLINYSKKSDFKQL